MLQNDVVSIIVPFYNRSRYLQPCLDSLLKQTYKHLEVILVNDHSTDDSGKIIRSFAKTDKRLKIIKNKKRYGLAVSLNRALDKAKGQFVAFMNPNDTSRKDRLKKQLQFLLTHPKVVAVGTQCTYIDRKNKEVAQSNFPTYHEAISPSLFAGLTMQFETAVVNRAILPKDALKFQGSSVRYLPLEKQKVYAEAFLRLLSYGMLANLTETLHTHRNPQLERPFKMLLKLWIKALTFYKHTPSFRTLFHPKLNIHSA